PAAPRCDRGAERAPGGCGGRHPLPPSPCPGRSPRHAPAPGPLLPRSGHTVCEDRLAGAGPRGTVHGHRDVSGHGDDVLAPAGGDGAGVGTLAFSTAQNAGLCFSKRQKTVLLTPIYHTSYTGVRVSYQSLDTNVEVLWQCIACRGSSSTAAAE